MSNTQEVRAALLDGLNCGLTIRSCDDLLSLYSEAKLQNLENRQVIISNQHNRFHGISESLAQRFTPREHHDGKQICVCSIEIENSMQRGVSARPSFSI